MRRSLLVLAAFVVTPALYAQADSAHFTREQVLEIFSQYNPSVLERAKTDTDYNAVLESFLSAYEEAGEKPARMELIAVARNFDNSIRLQALADVYRQAAVTAGLMGQNAASVENLFRADLTQVFSRVWAVTVCLREYELSEAKHALKEVRSDKSLTAEARETQLKALKKRIRVLKTEIKSLKCNRGAAVVSAVDSFVRNMQEEQIRLFRAAFSADAAFEAENLQIKSNNKKPVAE